MTSGRADSSQQVTLDIGKVNSARRGEKLIEFEPYDDKKQLLKR